ncbi:rhamnogalacturonan acetylesterase [Kiritimatiellaeota bacterium B1221]|nr:rhamnogalacturonan acetylesterase [Kiritimatiellaeota bacterium B1221]
MIRFLSPLLIVLLLFFTGFLPAVEIANPELTIADDGRLPEWRGPAGAEQMIQITEDLPPGVEQGIQLTVKEFSMGDGSLVQRIYLKESNQRVRISYWAKSEKDRTAYVMVKRIKERKELERIRSDYSGSSWKLLTLTVETGDADALDVILRWRTSERYVGSRCSFAMVSAQEPALKVATVGDSIVQDYPLGNSRRGWGQILPKAFSDEVLFQNFAIGGRSSKTFRERGDWQRVLDFKPDYIFIQFGHNDSHEKSKPESTDASTEYYENLKWYVEEARKAGATPVLVSPPHRRVFTANGIWEVLTPYANSMKKVGAELNVPVIDLTEWSKQLLLELGEEGSIPLYSDAKDRSHYSEKGARLMAGQIVMFLQENPVGDLADYFQASFK